MPVTLITQSKPEALQADAGGITRCAPQSPLKIATRHPRRLNVLGQLGCAL